MPKAECSSKYHLGKLALRKSLKYTIPVERQMATSGLKGVLLVPLHCGMVFFKVKLSEGRE